MRFSDEFLNEVRSHNDIVDVISPYVNLQVRGANATGLCPFHNEKTPSFVIYINTQSYYCFGCQMGGDAINFIKNIENIDYVEAVKLLAEKAGLALPMDGFDDSVAKMKRRLLEANREAARFFYSNLSRDDCKEGYEYFRSRGLTKETIKRFGLGFAQNKWDSLIRHLKAKGYTETELLMANLATKTKNGHVVDTFRNRVIFPIVDVKGSVIAFGGRVLDDSKPKYVNTSDTPVYKKSHGVFGLNLAKQGSDRTLILCEGYMDVIAYHQAGFTNAVAALGTAFTTEQAKILSKYADEIILSQDADEAGQKAIRKAINILSTTPIRVRVARLEGGKDPDEIIKKHGKDRMRAILDNAMGDTEFDLIRAKAGYDLSSSEGKIAYLGDAVAILAKLKDPIKWDVFASKLSSELSVSKDAIIIQIQKRSKQRDRREKNEYFSSAATFDDKNLNKVNPQRQRNITAAKAEERLLSSLLANPDFYFKIKDEIKDEYFATDVNLQIYKLIATRLEEKKGIDVTYLSQDLPDEQISYIVRLESMRVNLGNTVKECLDCIERMKQEKKLREEKNPAQLTDDEWAALFKKQ